MIKIKNNKITTDLDLLGQELRRARMEKKISQNEAASQLQINSRYLEAIENGRLSDLPAGIYGRKFLAEYARLVGVDASAVLDALGREPANGYGREQARLFSVKRPHFRFFITIPRLVKNFLIAAAVIACLGYLGFCFRQVTSPPPLVVNFPDDNLVMSENAIEIRGTAESEAKITVNGESVLADAEGNFSQTISLKTGLNTIIVTAQKQYSRKNTITRNVMVKQKDL